MTALPPASRRVSQCFFAPAPVVAGGPEPQFLAARHANPEPGQPGVKESEDPLELIDREGGLEDYIQSKLRQGWANRLRLLIPNGTRVLRFAVPGDSVFDAVMSMRRPAKGSKDQALPAGRQIEVVSGSAMRYGHGGGYETSIRMTRCAAERSSAMPVMST